MSNRTKNFRPKARYFARRLALQAIYQWQVANTPIETLEIEFLNDPNMEKADIHYFREILRGVIQKHTQLDQQMEPFLNRPISDVNLIELTVLRIAIYELLQRFDVPYRVILNEALELTKQFGTIEGYKFVNGALDKIAKQLREQETQKNA